MTDKDKLPWGLKQVAPGSIKSLSKDKLEAFDQGTLNPFAKKHLSKKEQEELRKRQEDQAAAEVLQDFVASFDSANKVVPKMFVKGSVINPLSKDEKATPDKGAIYKPALKLVGKTTPTASPVATPPVKNPLAVKKDVADAAAVAALAEQDRIAKKKLKKRENLILSLLKRS